MAQVMEFRVDYKSLQTILRHTAPEISKELTVELREITKSVIKKARTGVPSGMVAEGGRSGFQWSATRKTVEMRADGSDRFTSPKSWAAATETGPWKHPVYGHGPRKKWAWGPKNGSQPPLHLLQSAWDEAKGEMIPRMDAAVKVAIRRAGLSE